MHHERIYCAGFKAGFFTKKSSLNAPKISFIFFMQNIIYFFLFWGYLDRKFIQNNET